VAGWQIFRTLTDFIEGPNRKVIGTLRTSSDMGRISFQLLKYLGSRMFPSQLLAKIGYHGADKHVEATNFGTSKVKANRPEYRQTKDSENLHAPPVWMDDPCTQVALSFYEQTKLVTRVQRGNNDKWKTKEEVHQLYANWRRGIGRDPRKSFLMLLRWFEKLELSILNTIQRQVRCVLCALCSLSWLRCALVVKGQITFA
jgi:hypothetical protein